MTDVGGSLHPADTPLRIFGVGVADAQELAVMRASERLLDPMLEAFLRCDLSSAPIEDGLHYATAPAG
jgi:hypothetical protein